MEGAEMDLFRYFFQVGLMPEVLLQVLDRLLDSLVIDIFFFACQDHKSNIYDSKLRRFIHRANPDLANMPAMRDLS